MIGFSSYGASTASPALASIVAEGDAPPQLMGSFAKVTHVIFRVGEETRRAGSTSLFWPNEPDGEIHRQVADEPNGTARLRNSQADRTDNDAFPQTNPTSANEANLENPMKTMFEHEQHDAGLLGRRARDTAQ